MCSRSHRSDFLLKLKTFKHQGECFVLGTVTGASGCMRCQYIRVLISEVVWEFTGSEICLTYRSVAFWVLKMFLPICLPGSNQNLFSKFLLEKHDSLWNSYRLFYLQRYYWWSWRLLPSTLVHPASWNPEQLFCCLYIQLNPAMIVWKHWRWYLEKRQLKTSINYGNRSSEE